MTGTVTDMVEFCRVLGDDVFDELKAGTRLPTADEFAAGDECFAEEFRE